MKTPEQIASEVSGRHFDTYQDSAEEVGHPEGQPIVETWPALRECIAAAIEADRAQRDADEVARKVWVRQDFVDDLEGRELDLTAEQIERIVDDAVNSYYADSLNDCTDQEWELVSAAVSEAIKGEKEG